MVDYNKSSSSTPSSPSSSSSSYQEEKAYILIVWLRLKRLQRLKRDAHFKQKNRQNFRETLSKVCKENPNIAKNFKSFTRGNTGLPRLEHDQQDLMAPIIKLVQSSSTAAERRRTECMRTVTTLDDLTTDLPKLGYILSHSAVYLR